MHTIPSLYYSLPQIGMASDMTHHERSRTTTLSHTNPCGVSPSLSCSVVESDNHPQFDHNDGSLLPAQIHPFSLVSSDTGAGQSNIQNDSFQQEGGSPSQITEPDYKQRFCFTGDNPADRRDASNNHCSNEECGDGILATSSFHQTSAIDAPPKASVHEAALAPPTGPYSNSSAGSDAIMTRLSSSPTHHSEQHTTLLPDKVPEHDEITQKRQDAGSSTTTSSSLSNNSMDEEDHRELVICTQHSENTCICSDDEQIVPMTVDTCEHFWTRMHDVRIHGSVLEYTGVGNTIHDNGFAQSNVPLTPISHYFEITILDPGENCYIAIGLARKDYNVHKNPGWCRGSIAYHADDGKIFIGGGVGTPFGPRCSVLDILGCGIVFPEKYASVPVDGTWPWEQVEDAPPTSPPIPNSRLLKRQSRRMYSSVDNFGYPSTSDSEDDIWWDNKNHVCEDKVKVFFMRNRKLLGIKEVRIPKGGFFPTIGMMSANERVSVDLNPLTG